jgi:protein-S-isoprenylcysteine O-methyltransferase Ste14
MHERDSTTAGVIAPSPLIFGGPLALGLLLQRRWPLLFLPVGVARPLGLLLTLGGLTLGFWFAFAFRRAGTSPNPNRPATVLVTSGPFRFTRTPGYLGMTLLYTGISSLANALWPMILLPPVLYAINRGVIDREERHLEQ